MKKRQWLISLGVFVLMLGILVSVDERVHDQFAYLMASGSGIASWDDRAFEFGRAIVVAVRYQSIDNAPLLVFATAGTVLFFFMVRT
jgi:hypothetical protein